MPNGTNVFTTTGVYVSEMMPERPCLALLLSQLLFTDIWKFVFCTCWPEERVNSGCGKMCRHKEHTVSARDSKKKEVIALVALLARTDLSCPCSL